MSITLFSKLTRSIPGLCPSAASIDQLKGECSSLKIHNELSDANMAKAKGLVARLNKEIESQKTSIETI